MFADLEIGVSFMLELNFGSCRQILRIINTHTGRNLTTNVYEYKRKYVETMLLTNKVPSRLERDFKNSYAFR